MASGTQNQSQLQDGDWMESPRSFSPPATMRPSSPSSRACNSMRTSPSIWPPPTEELDIFDNAARSLERRHQDLPQLGVHHLSLVSVYVKLSRLEEATKLQSNWPAAIPRTSRPSAFICRCWSLTRRIRTPRPWPANSLHRRRTMRIFSI